MKKKDLLRRIEQLETRLVILEAERHLPALPNPAPAPWSPLRQPIVWCGQITPYKDNKWTSHNAA